jgi:hypothetical protein
MLGLGLSLAKPYKISKPEFNVLDLDSLVIYNELGAWTYLGSTATAFVDGWPNHSSLSSDYDLSQSDKSYYPTIINDRLSFNNQSLNGQLNYGVQLDSDTFTLVLSLDLNENFNLSNEGVIGRGLNDLLKLYRGATAKRIGFKLEGTNYDENNLDVDFPLGEFILTATRSSSGVVVFYFNNVEVGGFNTNPNEDFRITQIGSGELHSSVRYDGYINEVYLFNEVLTSENRENVINFALNKL